MFGVLENRPFVDQALGVSALTSAALLASAHLSEKIGGLAPCPLCLDQREAHWTALALALIGIAAGAAFRWRRAAAATAGACAFVYFVSAGLAFYHAGIENHYWPGPATCAGGGPVDIGDALPADVLADGPDAPGCTEAAWRLLGVSMAGFNLIISAGLFALCYAAAWLAARAARKGPRAARGSTN